jgi:hypothetical protein
MAADRLLSARMTYNACDKLERNLRTLSLLTNYRPNFCSECGEKIVRLRWRFWTSRRFCDKCSARFRRPQLLHGALAAIVLMVVGVLIGRGTRQKPTPLVVERLVNTPATQNSASATTPVAVEDVYICGARTKKGTPCSRRVHGPVRCWQHKGLPAMLPVDKLRVSE